jgi:hypothetical protein
MELDVNHRDSRNSMAEAPEHYRAKSPSMNRDSINHTSGNQTSEPTSLNDMASDTKIRSPNPALVSSHVPYT